MRTLHIQNERMNKQSKWNKENTNMVTTAEISINGMPPPSFSSSPPDVVESPSYVKNIS